MDLYGYLFRGLKYLFLYRIFVWNGCLVRFVVLNGRKICIEKMLGFRGDAILLF